MLRRCFLKISENVFLINHKSKKHGRKSQSLEKKLEKQEERITKLQNLLVDGTLSIKDYTLMKQRYSAEKAVIEGKLIDLKAVKSNLNQSLNIWICPLLWTASNVARRSFSELNFYKIENPCFS